MEFGTTLFFENILGFKRSMEKASKAGFKYIDFDLTEHNDPPINKEEKFFSEVNEIAKDNGLIISQAHAPYIKGLPTDYSGLNEKFYERVKNSIRRCAYINSPYLVYHPAYIYEEDYENVTYDYSKIQDENFKRNVDFISKFEKDLKEYNVKMALENVNAHDFINRKAASTVCCTSKECNAFIDALGDDNFCICLDIGHLNLVDSEPISDFIRKVNGRIKVLHLHDNFGIQNDWFGELDRHLLPFFGSLDWESFAMLMKEIKYKGIYSFECGSFGPVDFVDEYYSHVLKSAEIIFNK